MSRPVPSTLPVRVPFAVRKRGGRKLAIYVLCGGSLSVIEQTTYLPFIKRLDELQTLEENKAAALGRPVERRIFPDGKDEKGRAYSDLRWSRFRNFEARDGNGGRRAHLPFRSRSRGDAVELRAPHARCAIDPQLLYESPSTDLNNQGLAGVFSQIQSSRIIETLHRINAPAAA